MHTEIWCCCHGNVIMIIQPSKSEKSLATKGWYNGRQAAEGTEKHYDDEHIKGG